MNRTRNVLLSLFWVAAIAIMLVGVSLVVGWNYRTTRFASGLRIVEENGGSFTQRSEWQAHATDIHIGRQTDLDDLSMILSLLMAGQVVRIDFSDVEFTKSEIVSLPNWVNNSIGTVEWPVEKNKPTAPFEFLPKRGAEGKEAQ